MKAYQVYQGYKKIGWLPTPTKETGEEQYKFYCSECGCPVYSDTFPSLRQECPHCHAELSVDRLISYDTWTAELQHVGYTLQECGRDQ